MVTIQAKGDKNPIFFMHPIGGYVLCYVDLSRHLGNDYPFYGLQMPGMEGDRLPYDSIEEMASLYLAEIRNVQPQGPYQLAGFSFGGQVAYEVAHQLRMSGEDVSLLVLFDCFLQPKREQGPDEMEIVSSYAARLTERDPALPVLQADVLREKSEEERLTYLLGLAKTKHHLPPDAGLDDVKRALNVWMTHSIAISKYTPPVYGGDIVFFQASERVADSTVGWQEIIEGTMEVVQVPGTHYTMLRMPKVAGVADILRTYIDRVHGKTHLLLNN
jgi:thioesterase domain-containing protein